jgi:hypothetical protein
MTDNLSVVREICPSCGKTLTEKEWSEHDSSCVGAVPGISGGAVERAVLEARIEEAKWWQDKVRSSPWSALSEANRERIAVLEQALAKLNEPAKVPEP